jgi:hypothetical protein
MIWPQYLLRWKTRAVKSINAIKDGIAMNKFDLSEILFRTVCPNNEIITDDAGKPSVMVYIPKFTMKEMIAGGSDRVHPAFVVNGVERDGFYISKYQNTEIDRRGYSLPAEIPRNCVGFDLSRSKCTAKGRGWHLTTIQEWGAIALWCKKNGHLPYGNNDYGKDKRENMYRAIRVSNVETGKGRVLTGTGPLSWSHDHTVAGIWDLNGNLSEWVGGFRTVYGELQVLPDNDGADLLNSQDAGSTAWRAIDAATGAFLVPDGKGTTKGSIKADYVGEGWGGRWKFTTEITSRVDRIRRCDMSHIIVDDSISPAARELLYAYALIGDDPFYDYREQHVYLNNGCPECFMYRGGYWGSGAFAGVFAWSCSWGRDHNYEGNGFRASYIPLD